MTASSISRIVVAIMMFASASARADPGVVVVGGSANERDRGSVKLALESTVRDAGWTLRADPLPKRDADALLGCKDHKSPWTCVPASLGSGGVVLVAHVENRQSDTGTPMIVITGQVIAADARVAAAGSQYCEPCAGDKLSTSSTELARQLLRDLSVRSGRTMIDVRSTPTGAEVNLDGRSVGVTDATFNTFPGAHVVVVQKPGFGREVREVVVQEGKTVPVTVTLQPVRQIDRRDPPRSRLVPAIVASVGLVALAGGTIVSWVVDAPPSGPQPEYIYSGPALGVAAAGAVVLGVGGYLWWRGGKRTSAPNVSFTRGGATAGWAASF